MSLESDVKQFLEHVLGPGEGFLALAFRYGKRFEPAFYEYPADLDRAVQVILDRSGKSDVFFCAHLVTATKRRKGYASPVYSLWADGDGEHDFSLGPEPTAVIETSPGHHHAFYRLDRAIEPAAAERLNRALARATGADPSGWDQTQLLRIHGTLNHKYDPPVPVRLVQFDSDRRLEPEAFETLPEADAEGHAQKIDRKAINNETVPPVPLRGDALRRWRGKTIELAADGTIDRSASLFLIGRDLAQHGATQAEIEASLAERDESLGFEKFADRKDGPVRIRDIAEKVTNSSTKTSALPATHFTTGYEMTDLGNAERLEELYGDSLRYAGDWFVWDGMRWVRNPDRAMHLSSLNARAIRREAQATNDERLWSWARRSATDARMEAALKRARTLERIPAEPDDFDARDHELNLPNGILSLTDRCLTPHEPAAMHTKVAGVVYDSVAEAPRFLQFLNEIFAGDLDLIEYVRRAVGYSLSGDTREQVFFLLHGPGANGKSTLTRLLQELMGDYAMQCPVETFLSQLNRSATNDLARLRGSRLCLASEVAYGRKMDEALIKGITGGERITARALYKEYVEFQPKFKVMLATNYLPEISDFGEAIWRRIHVIPFETTIPEDRRDPFLFEKLRQELPGVLNWALAGYRDWSDLGLRPPLAVQAAKQRYRREMNSVRTWIDEECERGENVSSLNPELYASYERWCETRVSGLKPDGGSSRS